MYSATEPMPWPQCRPALAQRPRSDRWRWALVVVLVSLAHLLVWNLAQQPREQVAPRVAQRMTAMLVAPPARPEPIAEVVPEPAPPQPIVQTRPEPKPEPKPQPKPRIQPEPAPKPVVKPIEKPTPKPKRQPPTVPASNTPAPVETAKPSAVAAPPPAIIEAPRFDAAYLSNEPPAYPLAARRRGIEGNVLLRAQISKQGTCLRAEIKRGSGSDVLDSAALDAVKKWRFVPARQGHETQVAWVEIPIAFRLDNL